MIGVKRADDGSWTAYADSQPILDSAGRKRRFASREKAEAFLQASTLAESLLRSASFGPKFGMVLLITDADGGLSHVALCGSIEAGYVPGMLRSFADECEDAHLVQVR